MPNMQFHFFAFPRFSHSDLMMNDDRAEAAKHRIKAKIEFEGFRIHDRISQIS